MTGDGATEAFRSAFLPFLEKQAAIAGSGAQFAGANYRLDCGDASFCFFDAYDPESLEWLEAALAKRQGRHCFVIVHPPVVPYGARAAWYLFAAPKDRARREKLLGLLGQQEAMVFGGHLHKFSSLTRRSPGGGRFSQLGVSSIINAAETSAKDVLGDRYDGDQVLLEPNFSPETAHERRQIYEAERSAVRAFAYADLPGYAVVRVDSERVEARIYSGVGDQLWRTVDLRPQS